MNEQVEFCIEYIVEGVESNLERALAGVNANHEVLTESVSTSIVEDCPQLQLIPPLSRCHQNFSFLPCLTTIK